MKTAYPTTADLARFLSATSLFPALKVTASAASSTTATLNQTADVRVGDTLFFAGSGEARTVSAIPSATTVTIAALTTTAGEAVTRFPAAFNLSVMVEAGIQAFEDAAGRKIMATADTERRFDLPMNPAGMLDLKADLATLTSLSVAGEAKTLYTHFRPLPEDAPAESKPYNRVQFLARYLFPLGWSVNRTIAITGRWGMFSSATGMPEDAWVGMLLGGAILLVPQISTLISRGLLSWGEDDMNERYGEKPLGGMAEMWQGQFEQTAHRYRRVVVGIA